MPARALAAAVLALAALPACIAPAQAAPRLQLDRADLGPAGLDPADLGPADLDPAGLDPAGLDPPDLDPAGIRATRELYGQALRLLPPAMRALDGQVRLRWRDDLPPGVHGRAHATRIGLRRELLEAWMRRAPGQGLDDPGARAALSALLHELAHVYDRTDARLSSEPRLLDLAGWQRRPWRLGRRRGRNDFRDRSPDPYELDSPAEFVAVNLEHFLLDADYACRRPALHRYFVAHFGWAPDLAATGARCAPGLAFVSTEPEAGEAELLQLDPARVYAVDYLLAEGNARAMSRWGHSMLRLVVCAPGRVPGPDCRLDLAHHRVLSFRAFVDDVQISGWRGLTGRYPSRLFVLPLEQVVDEYTKVELRALDSIPLRLDRDEVAALLERAARVHWSYDGRYYFVGNNCAVETWKLLHDGIPRLAAAPLRSITPRGLLRRLARAGIADTPVLEDRARAIALGYRFESLERYFREMYRVADAELGLPQPDVLAWFALDPAQRTPWLARLDPAGGRGAVRAAAALLLLEQAALRREELLARDELKRRYLGGRGHGAGAAAGAALDTLQALLADAAFVGRPSLLLQDDAGYGLPQAGERARLRSRLADGSARLSATRRMLSGRVRALLPDARRRRLEGAEANLELLGSRLRSLDPATVAALSHGTRGP